MPKPEPVPFLASDLNQRLPLPITYQATFGRMYRDLNWLPKAQEPRSAEMANAVDRFTLEMRQLFTAAVIGPIAKTDMARRLNVAEAEWWRYFGIMGLPSSIPRGLSRRREVFRMEAVAIEQDAATITARVLVNVQGEEIPIDEVLAWLDAGEVPVLTANLAGQLTLRPVRFTRDKVGPRILIREHYGLTITASNYGSGRVLSTFSLWPGERTTLYLRSWQSSAITRTAANSVFDSFTASSAAEFQEQVNQENSLKSTSTTSASLSIEMGGGIDLGIVDFSSDVAGSVASTKITESLGRTMYAASKRHASSTSSKRDVSVSTSTTVEQRREDEVTTERLVENTNLGAVMTLVCRELTQQFYSALTLKNVTIAFENDGLVFEEAELPLAPNLLVKYTELKPEEASRWLQEKMPKAVTEATKAALDAKEGKGSFDLTTTRTSAGKFPSTEKRDEKSKAYEKTYPDIVLEGYPVREWQQVVRTPGVIFDTILSQTPALDPYSTGMREAKLLEATKHNALLDLVITTVSSEDKDKAELLHKIGVSPEKLVLDRILKAIEGSR